MDASAFTAENPLHLYLLGGFRVEQGGQTMHPAMHKGEVLIAFLALRRGLTQSRQQLAFLLWVDSPDVQARSNLRTLLHRVRTGLPGVYRCIGMDARHVWWSNDVPATLDVNEFEQAIAQADTAEESGDSGAALAALKHADVLYQGDLLPDCYDDWIAPERERLRALRLKVLERLVQGYEKQDSRATAIVHARRLIAIDPLHEWAYLALMRLYGDSGDRAAALRAYHTCVTAFREELHSEPSEIVRTAYTRLLSGNAEQTPLLPTHAPLVGRDADRQRLQTVWARAVNRQPKLLLISGEAGIGKTRLAEEMLGWVRRQSADVAVAHCYASEADLAYAPVIAWQREPGLVQRLKRLDSTWLTELSRLLPEIRVEHPEVGEPLPLHEPWQRQRLFEALARAALQGDRPLLLFIDDLQWCDRDTLEWMHFLLHFDAKARLLIVATARIDEIDENKALLSLLADLRHADRLDEIALGTLSRQETLKLAQHLTCRVFDARTAEHLYADTEGNPLFIVEMVRAGEAQSKVGPGIGEVTGADPAANLPPKLQAIVEQRLSHLTPASQEVLRAAAVVGHSFTFDVLLRTAESDEEGVVRAVDELWRRRIIREQGVSAYDFTHDTLRAVAYAGVSHARQRMLHRRVAEALETIHAADLDPVSAQLAYHYERGGLPERAAPAYRQAAELSQRVYANTDAINNYERALKMLDSVRAGPTTERHNESAAAIATLLGDVLHQVGRRADARSAYANALNYLGDSDMIARSHVQRKIGNCARDQHQYDEAHKAYEAAERALGEPAALDATGRQAWIDIQLERIDAYYWLARIDEMRESVDRLRPVIEQHGTAQQRAQLYQMLTLTGIRLNRYVVSDEMLGYARAFVAAFQELGDMLWLPSALFQLGFALLWRRELAEAERHMLNALALAEQHGDVSLEGRCLTYLTILYRWRNQLNQTRSYAERSLRHATSIGMHEYIGAAHGNLAWLAWRGQDLSMVREHGQLALDEWRPLSVVYIFQWIARWPLIGAAMASGAIEEALVHARMLLDRTQPRMPAVLQGGLEDAVRAAGAGDLTAARSFLEQLLVPARELNYL
jgi:DNA-binding SARP family transcriptional activator